jgi:hypothetical protein
MNHSLSLHHDNSQLLIAHWTQRFQRFLVFSFVPTKSGQIRTTQPPVLFHDVCQKNVSGGLAHPTFFRNDLF